MEIDLALIAGDVNERGLYRLTEAFTPRCLEVKAAIAYASADNMTLLDACRTAGKPMTYYARYDLSVPTHPEIIKWFLDQKNPNLICRVVPETLHAKVIWWVGCGAYIGSANMTHRAWFKNIEAGVFVPEDQLMQSNLRPELERFFQVTHESSRAISKEFHAHLLLLANSRKAVDKEEKAHRQRFPPYFPAADTLVRGTTTLAESKSYLEFQRDWTDSLQFLRDIGDKLDQDGNRPHWVPDDTPTGAHVDQFIHAYYYKSVQGALGEPYVKAAHHSNRMDRLGALNRTVRWWNQSDFDYNEEQAQLSVWATLIRETFSRDRILTLTENEFSAAMTHVHALREVARYRKSSELGLPFSTNDIGVKVDAHLKAIWRTHNKKGQNILELLNDVIWIGSGKVEWRIWSSAKLAHLKIHKVGLSTLGELLGWVRPYDYTPRNNRTLKGLYALGYSMPMYDSDE